MSAPNVLPCLFLSHSGADTDAARELKRRLLDSPDARTLRIVSEYLYPLSHFKKEKVRETIVFFGSARITPNGPMGRYYNEARELARAITAWSMSLEGEAQAIASAASFS